MPTHRHVDVSLWYVLAGQIAQPLEPDPGEFVDSRWWAFADIATEPRADPQLPRFITKLTRELSQLSETGGTS